MVKINFWINQSPKDTSDIKHKNNMQKWKMENVKKECYNIGCNQLHGVKLKKPNNYHWDIRLWRFANIIQIAGDLHGMCRGIDFFPSKDQDNKNTKYKLALDDF